MSDPVAADVEQARMEDALREIGVLMMALAPLDAAFAPAGHGYTTMINFVLWGALMFLVSVRSERRRKRG